MNESKETQVLAAIRKSDPKKKRVNFFISESSKAALGAWSKKNNVSESSAVEQMIRTTIPVRFFKGEK